MPMRDKPQATNGSPNPLWWKIAEGFLLEECRRFS